MRNFIFNIVKGHQDLQEEAKIIIQNYESGRMNVKNMKHLKYKRNVRINIENEFLDKENNDSNNFQS